MRPRGSTAAASSRRGTCLPLARGSGLSSGWLNVTTSPVIPRPVGPTTDWYGSATTTASRPRIRMHVRPYQVSSIQLDSDTAACIGRFTRGRGSRAVSRIGVPGESSARRRRAPERAHWKCVSERRGAGNAAMGRPARRRPPQALPGKGRPEAPAQSAPPVGGREEGTVEGSSMRYATAPAFRVESASG